MLDILIIDIKTAIECETPNAASDKNELKLEYRLAYQ